MTEEKIIDGLKQIKEMFDNMEIHGNLFINRPDIYAGVVNLMLDLYNKQREEIERFKNAEEYAKLGKEELLDTIHKQEKEIKELKKPKFILNAETGTVTKIHNDYISKDKIKEIFYNKRNKIIFIKNRNERLDKVKILDEIEKELLEEGEPDAK